MSQDRQVADDDDHDDPAPKRYRSSYSWYRSARWEGDTQQSIRFNYPATETRPVLSFTLRVDKSTKHEGKWTAIVGETNGRVEVRRDGVRTQRQSKVWCEESMYALAAQLGPLMARDTQRRKHVAELRAAYIEARDEAAREHQEAVDAVASKVRVRR